MLLYIKNMVCHRCKLVVKSALEKLDLHPLSINLGEVTIEEEGIDPKQLTAALKAVGFELLDDRRSKLIEQIKTTLIALVHYSEYKPKRKVSDILSTKLHHDYSYLSNLFSEVEGITIEQFIIHQKIEKVKELLTYDELSLSEIAIQLGYSSTAHLSGQFKKLTGYTPSYFKQFGKTKRTELDKI